MPSKGMRKEMGDRPCPNCGRAVQAGIADYGRLWSWLCATTDGGCGTLIHEEPRDA